MSTATAFTKEQIEQLTTIMDERIQENQKTSPILSSNSFNIERLIRIEEELKNQRELMKQGFDFTEKRFEAVDKRFDRMTTFISIGFVVMGVLMSVYKFLN